MKVLKNKIENYLKEIASFEIPTSKQIPNIDLYMDQVITYLERALTTSYLDQNERIITSSMINNYVKNNIIDPPKSKKYDQQNLSDILIICCLKHILSISDIGQFLKEIKSLDHQELDNQVLDSQVLDYDQLCKIQLDTIKQTIDTIQLSDTDDPGSWLAISYRLAIEADIKKRIAEAILKEFKTKNIDPKTDKKIKE